MANLMANTNGITYYGSGIASVKIALAEWSRYLVLGICTRFVLATSPRKLLA